MNMIYLALIIASTGALLYYVMVYIPKEHRRNITKKLGDLAALQREMDKLRDRTDIGRVLILKSHNGDGIPRMGYQIKITALYESYEQPFFNRVEDYQDLRADGMYVKMLCDVQTYGHVEMWTHEMEHCLLKSIYEKEGVNWSYIFFIGRDKHNWYYASLALHGSKSPFDLNQGIYIELFKNYVINQYAKLNDKGWKRIKQKLHL